VRLLEWILNLNKPFNELNLPSPVDRYLGLDAEGRMQELANARLDHLPATARVTLQHGVFWQSVPFPHLLPVNVICGSLVAHDLLESREEVRHEVFAECNRMLKSGGRLIFADCFTKPDQAARERQLAFWRRWMVRNGLPEQEVEKFFEYNQEMTCTITPTEFNQLAIKHGFVEPKWYSVPGHMESPFMVVVTHKRT
jgi:SAM-dependent methyltransferase